MTFLSDAMIDPSDRIRIHPKEFFYVVLIIGIHVLPLWSKVLNKKDMSEQKVVICKDLKSELQDFLSSLKYDKLFILMDTNTKEKCFPLVEDIPAFQKAPILVMEAGDMNKGFVSLSQIWTALSNEGASRNSLLVNLGGGMVTDMGGFAGATFKGASVRSISLRP